MPPVETSPVAPSTMQVTVPVTFTRSVVQPGIWEARCGELRGIGPSPKAAMADFLNQLNSDEPREPYDRPSAEIRSIDTITYSDVIGPAVEALPYP